VHDRQAAVREEFREPAAMGGEQGGIDRGVAHAAMGEKWLWEAKPHSVSRVPGTVQARRGRFS
jgi:hypothetical protein